MKHTLKNIQTKSKAIILLALLVCTSISTIAQRTKCPDHVRLGLNVNNYVNGNGHGGFYNIGVVLNSHRSTLAFGPHWQKAKKQFNGLGLTYSYTVVGVNASCHEELEQFNRKEELSLFWSINYYKNAILSNSTIDAEGRMSEEQNLHFKSLQLNTAEAYFGIGYNYLITHNIKIRSFIALGVYNHMNFNEPMSHEKMAPVLMTGIGIGFIK